MPKRIMVAVSGGLDSTVLAHDMVRRFGPRAVVLGHASPTGLLDEGSQRAYDVVRMLAAKLHVEYLAVPLSPVYQRAQSGSRAAIAAAARRGLAEKDRTPWEMTRDLATYTEEYVPGLYTQIWLSLGVEATRYHCDWLATGLICNPPRDLDGSLAGLIMDSSAEYLGLLNRLRYVIFGPRSPKLLAPYARRSKAWVVQRGLDLGADLGVTNSCDLYPPCGVCGECKLRADALARSRLV